MDLTKLKVKLTLKDAFLASIAYQLNLVEDPEIETAGTNGFDIKFNSEYMDNLTLDEQLGVLAHECMHVALQHTVRFNNIEKGNRHTYNVAGDMLINSWLDKHDFKLPSNCIQGNKAYLSSCTEEMYRQLLQENKDPSQGSDMNDDIQENQGDNNSSQGNQDIEDFTRTVLMKASASSNSNNAGSLNEIQRAFQELVKPKLPWFKLLRNYVNDYFPDDYSWKKPNRRFMEIAYLPSICDGEALRNINVYIDVSGSVSDETLNKYLSEVKKIFTDFEIQTLRLNLFSDGIVKTEVMTDGIWSDIDKDFMSGGTTISEVIEDINKYRAVVSLIITDGYFFDRPNQEARYPVIWCITDHPDFTYPFGKVIDMDTY